MSWFHEHYIMTFTLAMFTIFTINNAIIVFGGGDKKKQLPPEEGQKPNS